MLFDACRGVVFLIPCGLLVVVRRALVVVRTALRVRSCVFFVFFVCICFGVCDCVLMLLVVWRVCCLLCGVCCVWLFVVVRCCWLLLLCEIVC